MPDKEDELRKKTKENLDPKGWEALLEGVPPINTQASTPDPAPSSSERKEHVLRVTDETGLTSEQTLAAEPVIPPEKTSGKGGAGDHGKDLSRGESSSMEAEETKEHLQLPPPDPEINKKNRFSLLADRIRKFPQIRKALQYYQHISLREQRMVLASILFLILIFVYSLILGPLMDRNALLNRKIKKKREEITEMVRLRSSVVQDRGGMDRIRKIIEQRGKDFSVFAYLEQLATKAEMKDKIIYIKPQRETPVGRFKESLVQIKLEKIGMEALTRYLYQIETSEDLLYIKNLRMKQGKERGQTGLNVTLSVGTLILGS
ncbi:MAG: type II secretion system protein M [Deltaproteobacteria bacterium]|nr:type II secretion system protein M [Deltaproteobacteria bacterium]